MTLRIKPVKNIMSLELLQALALQNGQELPQELDPAQYDVVLPAPKAPKAPKPQAEPKPDKPPSEPKADKGFTPPTAPAQPKVRVSGGQELGEEAIDDIAAQLGMEVRMTENRASFWLTGKRVFIIEGKRGEFKGQYSGHKAFAVVNVEQVVDLVSQTLGTPLVAPKPPHENAHAVPETSVVQAPTKPESVVTSVEVELELTPVEAEVATPGCTRGQPQGCMCAECEAFERKLHEDFERGEELEQLCGFIPMTKVEDYSQGRKLNTPNMVQPTFSQGLMTFENPTQMYMWTIKDMLENAPTVKFGFKSYRSYKPFAFRILNTDVPFIMAPGHEWADTWDWYLDGLFDCIFGEEVIGGRSIRYDKFRRDKYPRANGAADWGFHLAMGAEGDDLLDWMRRAIRLDSTSRQAVCTLWQNNRDLKKRTKRGELDISKKEEYQRLPCPMTFQVTQANDSKGLEMFIHQRALDFDGAITSDIFRFSEFGHLIAIGGYPKGYSGSITMMAATTILESYGAEGFVVLGNMIEWYDSDPVIRENQIVQAYENTRQSSVHLEPNAPNQRAYDWFNQDLERMGVVYHNWLKCQWRLGLERMEGIQYAYFRDMLYASAAFEWMLSEYVQSEIKRSYPDTKQVQEHLDLPQTLGEYPAFHFLKKIKGYWQYFVAVECARHFIHTKQYDLLSELFTLTPQCARFKKYIMVDAMIYTVRKTHRASLKELPEFANYVRLFEAIFEPEEKK